MSIETIYPRKKHICVSCKHPVEETLKLNPDYHSNPKWQNTFYICCNTCWGAFDAKEKVWESGAIPLKFPTYRIVWRDIDASPLISSML
jgi:hypothetical protein